MKTTSFVGEVNLPWDFRLYHFTSSLCWYYKVKWW